MTRLAKIIIAIASFLAPFTVASAQGLFNTPGVGYEFNTFAGKVLKHSPKFHLPIPDLSYGFDLNIIEKTSGNKSWHQRRRFPTVGVGICYTNYGIDSVYGKCLGLYANLTIPIISLKNFQWTLRIGDGVGYVTHFYDRHPISDTINNAIGSHFNDYATFNTDLRYTVNEHWDVQAGLNFSHISDGSYHQPNLGVNLYGAHLGLRYFPVTSKPKLEIQKQTPLKNRFLFEARAGLAFTQSEAAMGPSYPVYLGSAYVSRRWRSKNKVFVGADYSYHSGVYAFMTNNLLHPGDEYSYSYNTGVFVGNEYLFGRAGIMLQVGYYLHQTGLKLDPYYEKLGGNFYLIQREHGVVKELFISALLKTHRTIAELAEFGIGFGI